MTTLSRSKNVAQYMLQEFHRVQFSFIGKLHDSGKFPIIQMRPYCTSVHVHVVSYSASVHVHVVSSATGVSYKRIDITGTPAWWSTGGSTTSAAASSRASRGGRQFGWWTSASPTSPGRCSRTSSGRLGRATPRRPTTYSATTATTSAMKPCSSSPAPPSLATSLSCHTKS
jgi:hypothetical protein